MRREDDGGVDIIAIYAAKRVTPCCAECDTAEFRRIETPI